MPTSRRGFLGLLGVSTVAEPRGDAASKRELGAGRPRPKGAVMTTSSAWEERPQPWLVARLPKAEGRTR